MDYQEDGSSENHGRIPMHVLDQKLLEDQEIQESVRRLGGQLITLPPTAEFSIHGISEASVLITRDFAGDLFQSMRKKIRIISPLALIEYAKANNGIPRLKRPLYNHALKGIAVLFSGYQKSEEDILARLTQMVHNMDGLVFPDFPKSGASATVTHVVTRRVNGEKYQHAVNMNIPVMKQDWIMELWNRRDSVQEPADDSKERFRAKHFLGLKFWLIGFGEADLESVKSQITNGEGSVASTVEEATHIVVDDANSGPVKVTSEELNGTRLATVFREDGFTETVQLRPGQVLVRSEWFWSSIKIDCYADPTPFSLLSPEVIGLLKKNDRKFDLRSPRSRGTPNSRLSSVEESAASFASLDRSDDSLNLPNSDGSCQQATKRFQTACEMLETEKSYVKILNGIIKTVEDAGAPEPNGPLLPEKDLAQLRSYFSKIHEIQAAHNMIYVELSRSISTWKEDALIGQIWLGHCAKLASAYPPFVNIFEEIRSFVISCEKKHPRFQAMLMLSQKDPDFGRQNLKELIIRPVQRLPSVQLLLKDLQRRTKENLQDYHDIGKAVVEIDRVLTLVNEKKRETEALNLLMSIENAPVETLGSHRNFVFHMDCVELSDNQFHKMGSNLAFLLYNDFVEIAKIRPLPTAENKKPLKHIKLVPLREIASIVDVGDCGDAIVGAFAIKLDTDSGPVSFKFRVASAYLSKKPEFLRTLAKEISTTKCDIDPTQILKRMDAESVGIESSDFLKSTPWEKACQLKRVVSKRITSISKQSGQKLKRAVSSAFLSPSTRFEGHTKQDPEGNSSPKKIFRR